MKRSRYSPCSASMICSSRAVPSVATTIACVSPRVNSAEPWVRGSTPGRIGIGRTVRPRLSGENLTAHDLGLELEQQIEDVISGVAVGIWREAFGLHLGRDL